MSNLKWLVKDLTKNIRFPRGIYVFTASVDTNSYAINLNKIKKKTESMEE